MGVPAAGQSVGGHDGLVGHCVNMLPLRARVDPERPFRAMLSEARSTVLDAYEHRRFTFGSLLGVCRWCATPAVCHYVSVVFNLDRGLGPEAMPFEGLRTELTTNARLFENFDLFLNAVEIGGKVILECQYNTDLLDRETVRRWLGVYESILRSVCERPEEQTGRLRVYHRRRRRAARRMERSERPRRPDRRACSRPHRRPGRRDAWRHCRRDRGRSPHLRELDARANGLALALARSRGRPRRAGRSLPQRSRRCSSGCSASSRPAPPMCRSTRRIPRRLDLWCATRGRPRWPSGRGRAGSQWASRTSSSRTGAIGRAVAPAPRRARASRSTTPRTSSTRRDRRARPRASIVPHRAVVNLLASVAAAPGMHRDDVLLAVTTLSFDISVSELLLPLTVGARVVSPARSRLRRPRLRLILESEGATLLARHAGHLAPAPRERLDRRRS